MEFDPEKGCLSDKLFWFCLSELISRGQFLETDPDPIAMVIRVELFIHKPCQTGKKKLAVT